MKIQHAIDIGNFSILAMSHDIHTQPIYMKSIVAPIMIGVDAISPGNHSVVVEGDFGRYHIGDRATEYGSVASGLVNRDKLDPKYFIPCLLATLGPVAQKTEYEVSLQWSLPDPNKRRSDGRTIGEFLREKLTDTFQYTLTSHQGTFDMKVRIHPQAPRPEGVDAIIMARQLGHIPKGGNVIGADIGGGTLDITAIGPRDNILLRSSYDGVKGSTLAGGKALAALIKNNPLMVQRVGGQLNLDDVMTALANPYPGENGRATYFYPADNDELIEFTDLTKQALANFFELIQGEIRNNFNQFTPTSGRMLFGGCAYLFKGRIPANAGIYVPQQPDFANIMALDNLNRHALIGA